MLNYVSHCNTEQTGITVDRVSLAFSEFDIHFINEIAFL